MRARRACLTYHAALKVEFQPLIDQSVVLTADVFQLKKTTTPAYSALIPLLLRLPRHTGG
eukprot:TRINITY_DN2338_c0_g1_i1.p3 TRINITY_DN2338_c0_g1~~TRINITY_DN2338_c0_g1_i1.p3  ORF type:complete len:60 (-),score=29.77 TRINITY_DN2338_c0_g1_i1:2-181(-)